MAVASTIQKPLHLKSGQLSDFKWYLTKWPPFVPISDPILNPDHLQSNLFWTIQILDDQIQYQAQFVMPFNWRFPVNEHSVLGSLL